MGKNIISKSHLVKYFNGEESHYENIECVIIDKENLEFLRKKYNLESFPVSSTGDNTIINLATGYELSSIMKERNPKIVYPHEKMMKYVKKSWIKYGIAFLGWLIVLAVVKSRYIDIKVGIEKETNEQLTNAQKIATNPKHEWHTVSSYKVPGPLDIDVVTWSKTLGTQKKADSISKVIKALSSQKDVTIKSIEQAQNNYQKETDRVIDSIQTTASQTAISITTDAKEKAQEIIDHTNPDDENAHQLAIQQAEKTISAASEKVEQNRAQANLQISDIKSRVKANLMYYAGKIDSVNKATTKQISILQKTLPSTALYTYDLRNTTQYMSNRWMTISSLSLIATILLLCGFLFFSIIVSIKAMKGLFEKEPKPKHYNAEYLRKVLLNERGYRDEVGVRFFTMSSSVIEDCSKLLNNRNSVYLLCNTNMFEFTSAFNDEKLSIQVQDHTEPLIYAESSHDRVFVFSGLSNVILDEEQDAYKEGIEF